MSDAARAQHPARGALARRHGHSHYLIATDWHVQVTRYWDFDYPPAGQAGANRSDADHGAEFRHELEESVRIRLRADVPVGVYLSGGLDSCSVLGLAARHHPDPVRASTLTFDQAAYDEGPIAREMAALAGAQFHTIPIRRQDLADNFTDAIHQAETLCVNAHGVAKYLLSRAVRDAGYKVVITGAGSDEVLGGHPHFRRDMLLYNLERQDPAAIQGLLEWLVRESTVSRGLLLPDGEIGPVEGVKRVLGYVPSWVETSASRAVKLQPLLSRGLQARYGPTEGAYPFRDDLDVRGQLTGRAPSQQSLYLWSKTEMAGYILTMLGNRMEMAHSIEGRVPFLDHKLIELIRSQPVHMKIRGKTEKYVLREAVRDGITDTVDRRQKHPFLSPAATLTPEENVHTCVQDMLRGPTLAAIPFFEQREVVALLDRLPQLDTGARTANDQVLMLLVRACVLQERFGLAV